MPSAAQTDGDDAYVLELQSEPDSEAAESDAESADPEQPPELAGEVLNELRTTAVIVNSDAHVATSRQTPFLRLSRLAPVACLLAMTLSCGAYISYQHLAAANLNDDLSGVSAQVSSARSDNGIEEYLVPPPDPRFDVYPKSVKTTPRYPVSASDRIVRSLPDVVTVEREVVVQQAASVGRDAAHASVMAAYSAYQIQDYATADRLYREALSIEPNHPRALGGLAATLQSTSGPAEALEYYERLLTVEPNNTVAVAAVLAAGGYAGNENAESEFKVLIQRFPDAAPLHFALGLHYAQNTRWPEARLAFSEAQRLLPDNADYSYNLAVSMEQLGQREAARIYYETALLNRTGASVFDRELAADRVSTLSASAGDF